MNILVKIIILTVINILSLQLEAQNSFTVTVAVENASTNNGTMFIALYNTKTGFLKKTFKGSKSAIENNKAEVIFDGIEEGTYAVGIFHDENNNGKMDTNFFGFPSEDYGCSNNATGIMGPPKWEDAKFSLKANKTVKITL
ncbi:MAG: DUF2141 domain-containing protein [Winogradskyella sp.]|uniref:DUF2141 domain-containing protein n=1 Tax=Winogradskyella sp. TaxID=1883156 RepID=UPI00385F8554